MRRATRLLELTEVESGIFDGFQPGEGRYVLQSAAAAPVRSADDMIGDWAVARGAGKPICLLTLAGSPAAADTLAAEDQARLRRFGRPLRPDVRGGWSRANWCCFLPRGQSWRFEENDANTWQRVPETVDPVLLMRQ